MEESVSRYPENRVDNPPPLPTAFQVRNFLKTRAYFSLAMGYDTPRGGGGERGRNYLAPINVSRIYLSRRIPFVFLLSSRSHLKFISPLTPLILPSLFLYGFSPFPASSATSTSEIRRSSLFNILARRRCRRGNGGFDFIRFAGEG